MGFEDRDQPVQFAQQPGGFGRAARRVSRQQLPELDQEASDQGMVGHQVVDHRGEAGGRSAQRGQQLRVLAGVVGVQRGAEAEAMGEQVRRDRGGFGRVAVAVAVGHLPAQGLELLPQHLVNLDQLLAQRDRAVGRSQRECGPFLGRLHA